MKTPSQLKAILLALLVTFLWSTSFILIKWGLTEIPPLTYAGLRYSLAFLCLLPFAFTKKNKTAIKTLKRNEWFKLSLYGLLFIAFTQGAMFMGLQLLPAVTVSLWLNFTPIVVAVTAIFFLREYPTILQWGGAILFIAGIVTYFFPIALSESQGLGLIVMTVGVLANSSSAVLGRDINRSGKLNPFVVTVISMGSGSVILLTVGIIIQGLPSISAQNIIYLLWLAVINTAFAFVIWNYTLRTLTAMESSIINGTMLIQIAVLAWIFLGEGISIQEVIGMAIAAVGAVLVQLRVNRKSVN
ncbi:MAG: DMT family transporter [Ignavibacteria bacterium]|nr:DMT family transporter [Ignavibacteria bacterium]